MLAAIAAGEQEQLERAERQITESERRRVVREQAEEADRGEHRKGSRRRGAYTARQKLKVRPP